MASKLSPNEIRDITSLLELGKPLPEKYRFVLFGDQRNVELVWDGKTNAVTDVQLPFQVIEQVDEPRSEKAMKSQGDLFDLGSGRQLKGWSNKLIWGDNKFVLSSLRSGPLRDEIEKNGGIKLVYIDPPFDVGADFKIDIEIGSETFQKSPNVLEELAYRDTWGRGTDSFCQMMFERFQLIKSVMAKDGIIYVHCDWRASHIFRSILDEVFSKENFINEISWSYFGFKRSTSKKFPQKHDNIISYSVGDNYSWNTQYKPHKPEYLKRWKTDSTGRLYRDDVNPTGGGSRIIYLDDTKGDIVDSAWSDISPVNPAGIEITGYPTQKPEKLLERIIETSSKPGDLILDCFMIALAKVFFILGSSKIR